MEAVYNFMAVNDEVTHDDYMRAFFRYKVSDLDSLLPHILEVLKRSEYEATYSRSEAIPQANDILLVRSPLFRPYNNTVSHSLLFSSSCAMH